MASRSRMFQSLDVNWRRQDETPRCLEKSSEKWVANSGVFRQHYGTLLIFFLHYNPNCPYEGCQGNLWEEIQCPSYTLKVSSYSNRIRIRIHKVNNVLRCQSLLIRIPILNRIRTGIRNADDDSHPHPNCSSAIVIRICIRIRIPQAHPHPHAQEDSPQLYIVQVFRNNLEY